MRLPRIEPDDYTPRQAEVAARIAGRRGSVRGPFQVWLNSPEVCERVESLGAWLRFESELPLRLREYSLLIAARKFDAQYSWNAHAAKAIEAGMPPATIESLARNERPVFDDPQDETFYAFCTELLETHFVCDDTFVAALEAFGPAALVETVASLGNYTMLGMVLNTFQVDLQADRQPPFPDVRGYAKVAPAKA